jgi:hypothetical protein
MLVSRCTAMCVCDKSGPMRRERTGAAVAEVDPKRHRHAR